MDKGAAAVDIVVCGVYDEHQKNTGKLRQNMFIWKLDALPQNVYLQATKSWVRNYLCWCN